MGVLFLMSISRFFRGTKMSFQHKIVFKDLSLSACCCWDSRLPSREMDQKLKFGGTIGSSYLEDSYLEFLFRHFKVFRLHAIQPDAAEAQRAHRGNVPSSCYMIGRAPNSFLIGHVTGLLFCLYVKLFFFHPFSTLLTFEAGCLALY